MMWVFATATSVRSHRHAGVTVVILWCWFSSSRARVSAWSNNVIIVNRRFLTGGFMKLGIKSAAAAPTGNPVLVGCGQKEEEQDPEGGRHRRSRETELVGDRGQRWPRKNTA